MNLSVMTFDESFGTAPRAMLSLFRKVNVSPADYDQILAAFGWEWNSSLIRWDEVYEHVMAGSGNGTHSYRMSRFL